MLLGLLEGLGEEEKAAFERRLIVVERGMHTRIGLTSDEVSALRERFAVHLGECKPKEYIVILVPVCSHSSNFTAGGLNITTLNDTSINRLCTALSTLGWSVPPSAVARLDPQYTPLSS